MKTTNGARTHSNILDSPDQRDRKTIILCREGLPMESSRLRFGNMHLDLITHRNHITSKQTSVPFDQHRSNGTRAIARGKQTRIRSVCGQRPTNPRYTVVAGSWASENKTSRMISHVINHRWPSSVAASSTSTEHRTEPHRTASSRLIGVINERTSVSVCGYK